MKLETAKFHFIGVGGIGMCGLAELLLRKGAQVSGSDLSVNSHVERLEKLGLRFCQGHAKENISEADVVVYSSAVPPSNPEMKEARSRKIPLIRRAEALAEIMRLSRGVAIAGSHGKTSTTSMMASIFLEAQTDPTIVVGGRFDRIQSTAHLGQGEWLIAEADESDGSFQLLSPEIAVITNIDSDHLDHFGSFENLERAFFEFASRIPFYGFIAACGDDPRIKKVFQNFSKRLITYGFDADNDYQIRGKLGRYEVLKHAETLAQLDLPFPGRHMALNSLAALIVALEIGIDAEIAVPALSAFKGVDRRFQFRGERSQDGHQHAVYEDYAHHPTEIRVTLAAFREKFPDRDLIVFFQPHRFSRTRDLWVEFCECFQDADAVYLTDIYAASEEPIDGIHAKTLSEQLKNSVNSYLSRESFFSHDWKAPTKKPSVFIFLGAGDIPKVIMGFLNG